MGFKKKTEIPFQKVKLSQEKNLIKKHGHSFSFSLAAILFPTQYIKSVTLKQ